MVYGFVILFVLIAGCRSPKQDASSNPAPTEVVAIRGEAGPTNPHPANNALTQTVDQGIAAMDSAKKATVKANQAVTTEQQHTDAEQ